MIEYAFDLKRIGEELGVCHYENANNGNAVKLYGVVQVMCEGAGMPLMRGCGSEFLVFVMRVRQTFDEAD